MGNICIDRLMNSFMKLERAVDTAKQIASQRGDHTQHVVDKLEKYQSILTKQRSLAIELCASVAMKDWPAANRHLRVINALSTMIRDDASALVGGHGLPHQQTIKSDSYIAN